MKKKKTIKQNSKITQVNKQTTIVNVGCPRRKKKSCRRKPAICGKISGRIFQLCNSEPKIYFRSIDSRPSGLIQIENKSNCVMQAIIQLNSKRSIEQTIEREQQVSIAVPSIKNLKIKCTGESDSFCRGLYSVCLREAGKCC